MTPSDLVVEYADALRAVVDALRVVLTGVERVGRPGVLAGKTEEGEYLRKGSLLGIGEFSFHGIGCLVEREDQSLIDFDWDQEGHEIFDSWRVKRFARSRGITDIEEAAIHRECRNLVLLGLLIEHPPGWFRLQQPPS